MPSDYFWAAQPMCCTNDLCGTRRRVEWMLTLGGGGPVGWPRMNLEMHLHLNSELASNEFLTEFAFKIRKIPSGFALVRQCREQATVGRTHASMSVGGHALPPYPLILKCPPPPPPPHTHTHHHHYPSVPKYSSQQHCLRG